MTTPLSAGDMAAGSFSLLLTGVPPDLAKRITEKVKILTIAGFGAGDNCDGQIGVTHGVVGFNVWELDKPKAAYRPVGVALFEAARKFMRTSVPASPSAHAKIGRIEI